MNINGWERLRLWGKRWWQRILSHAVILLYHRITEIDSDPLLLCVSPKNFEEHLQCLRQAYQPLSLQELITYSSQGWLPRRSVIITFDDGYADNLYQAKPLLEQYDLPASVFVISGAVGHSKEFWWYDLEKLLLQPGNLPEKLSISINSNTYSWELGASSRYNRTEYQNYRHWNLLFQEDPTSRHHIYRALFLILRPLSSEKQQHVLQQLGEWSGRMLTDEVLHRALTPGELRDLTAGGRIEIGAHSVTHPVLSTLSKEQQDREIQQSKEHLEAFLGQSVTSFAYPYGTQADYNSETITSVQEAGFHYACSNFTGLVYQDTAHFGLPRFLIRNWTREEFAYRLQQWFRGKIPKEGSY